MKGAFLYVDAGKGHYVPAVALADSFKRAGHEVVVEDLFNAIHSPFWKTVCKLDWRFCLHHPNYEKVLHWIGDHRFNYYNIKKEVYFFGRLRNFKEWFELEKPDFIVSTNFLGGIILPVALKKIGVDCPVLQYAADVFDSPKTGINNELYRMYVPSEYGKEKILGYGQSEESTRVCSFPLSTSFETCKILSKEEARKKLGLKDKFTILISLGGEGIGDVNILNGIAKRGIDCQVVVIGGKSKTTTRQFNEFISRNPSFDLVRPGFVNNVYDYLMACDMQVGKAGANALMEAMYIHRPSLISEVLFMAREVEGFFNKYHVGWCEDNLKRKLDIIESLYNNPEELERIDKNFKELPLRFGADEFRNQIIKDVNSYYNAK